MNSLFTADSSTEKTPSICAGRFIMNAAARQGKWVYTKKKGMVGTNIKERTVSRQAIVLQMEEQRK
jgi:hypothetical protein